MGFSKTFLLECLLQLRIKVTFLIRNRHYKIGFSKLVTMFLHQYITGGASLQTDHFLLLRIHRFLMLRIKSRAVLLRGTPPYLSFFVNLHTDNNLIWLNI